MKLNDPKLLSKPQTSGSHLSNWLPKVQSAFISAFIAFVLDYSPKLFTLELVFFTEIRNFKMNTFGLFLVIKMCWIWPDLA